MRYLVLIATYNEKENISSLLKEIFLINSNLDILVVDDNSPDKTYQVVEELMLKEYLNKLFLIKRSGKLGLGTAYVAGFKWALERNYDVILHMDADFSHNPKYIPLFFKEIENYDLVIGSRYVKDGGVINWGIIRKIVSIGGSIYSRIILGVPIKDLTGGFKCFKKEVLKKIDIENLKSNGYSFQVETTYKTFKNKFKIKEIPIIFEDRRVGQSKMSFKIFLEALIMIIRLKIR